MSGVFRSANQGRSWTSLGVPNPPIYPGGDTEGGQGDVHGAIAADPSNPNVVFISGDAQDIQFDKMGNPIKNANGCTTFNANVFRYTGTTWENVVCDGADGTAPHADSRFMTFDADGNLLQANDGGIARLLLPNNAAMRFWLSAVGNIRSAEFHSIAYDPLSNIIFGGTQDNGTPVQLVPGSITWNQLIGADGGVVAIDANQVSHPGMSIRYSSFQTFGFFNRSTWDASNIMLGLEPVGLAIMAGPGAGKMLLNFDRNISFAQPFALNAIDPARMLIGTGNLTSSSIRGTRDQPWLIGRPARRLQCKRRLQRIRPAHRLWRQTVRCKIPRSVLCRCRQ